jgi:rod shape-determining protein MreD
MTIVRIAILVFVAAIIQVSVLSAAPVLGAPADLLLAVVVSTALLRGSVAGAVAGFGAGLLVDVATMGTLGVWALLLTVTGFWIGRYAETTGRGRPQAPLIAMSAATLAVWFGAYALSYLLGTTVDASRGLVPVLPAVVWGAIVVYPVFLLVRRFVGTDEPPARAREVELVV